MGIGTLGGGDFFQAGLENSLYKKIVNTNFKQKKKKMIPIIISIISHFWSPKLKHLWYLVCICIFIFHGIYSPLPTNIFLWGLNFVFVSCRKGLGIFQISWEPSVLGGSNCLFRRGGLGHFLL